MSDKLRNLRKHMDETVLRDIDFSEASKEKVRKAVLAQTEHSSKPPWIYQFKNALSVAVCLLLLFGGVVYAVHQEQPSSSGAEQSSSSGISSSTKSYSTATKKQNNISNSKQMSQAVQNDSTLLVRIMSNGEGWKLTKDSLLRTKDSGKTWSPIGSFNGNHFTSAAFFLDANHAWVTTVSGDGTTKLYHTSDGGNSWDFSKDTLPSNGMFDFVNAQTGWYLQTASQGNQQEATPIYYTSNGGESWEPVSATAQGGSFPTTGQATGIGFARDQKGEGWLTGFDTQTIGQSWLYYTSDNGKKWQKDSFPVDPKWKDQLIKTFPPMFLGGDTILPVTFSDPTSGEINQIVFYHGDNQNWSQKGNIPLHANQVVYDFLNGSIGWVITDQTVYVTTDGGQNWNPVQTGDLLKNTLANGTAQELDISSKQDARLVVKMDNGNSKVLLTNDGGQTWNIDK